jgi:hypothetical protein
VLSQQLQQLLSHMAAKQKPQSLTLGWSEKKGLYWCLMRHTEAEMQICMMDYGNLSADGKTAYLKCYGIGTFEVLTGVDFYINNPDCVGHENDYENDGSGLPTGLYRLQTASPGRGEMPGMVTEIIIPNGLPFSAIKLKQTASW